MRAKIAENDDIEESAENSMGVLDEPERAKLRRMGLLTALAIR